MKVKDYFVLFASCIITKGVQRSLICDLQRGDVYFIPNDLYDLLFELRQTKFVDILSDLENDSHQILFDHIEFLLNNELGFWTDEPIRFPKLQTEEWDYPGIISNTIIDFNENSNHDLLSLILKINSLGCKHYQLRYYCSLESDDFEKIHEIINEVDRTTSYEVHVAYNGYMTDEYLLRITREYPKIKTLLIHSAPNNKIVQVTSEAVRGRMGNVFLSKEKITSSSHCGVIDKISATSLNNIVSYSESQNFNSCLNRKLGIDAEGSIKNCPSMENKMGHILSDNLIEIVNSYNFQSAWKITKSQIDTCDVCEFRDICLDCRAFTNDGSLYGKPEKCNYNPNLMSWQK